VTDTSKVVLTPAQARVAAIALDCLESLINGDIDGSTRSPWDAFAADAAEGEQVPDGLTDEDEFRKALDTARDELGKAASQ